MDIFKFSSLAGAIEAIKDNYRQVDLAKELATTPQQINILLHKRPHLIYFQISKWRKALHLHRADGDYFELLTLLEAFHEAPAKTQEKMLDRAFHLAGRLEEQIQPQSRPADSFIYWLDPILPILRNLTELVDFPVDEQQIPAWAANRLTYVGILGKTRELKINRIEIAWKWLRGCGAVHFSARKNRWIKATPSIFSKTILGPESRGVQSIALRLNQLVTYQDFSHEVGTPNLLGDMLATFSLPSCALPLLQRLTRDFLYKDILRKLNFAINRDDLARLKDSDPELYEEVRLFKDDLIKKGYDVPEVEDNDVDTTVQVLLATRRLTR